MAGYMTVSTVSAIDKAIKGGFKVSKKSYYNVLLTIPEVTAISGMVDFLNGEVKGLDKKSTSKKANGLKEAFKANVMDFLRGKAGLTATDVANGMGVTVQKVSPFLKALVAEGAITVDEVKKKKFYSGEESDTEDREAIAAMEASELEEELMDEEIESELN